jgi:hypothetical protein
MRKSEYRLALSKNKVSEWNDMSTRRVFHCIVLAKSLTLHCYKQQDNDDMKNISSETGEWVIVV